MPQKKLALIAKVGDSGIRRLLYREQLTNGHDQVKSDKDFDQDPDSLVEFLADMIQGRSFLPSTSIDGNWFESLYDTINVLASSYQPGTRNQIRVDIEEYTDPEDEAIYGRLYAKVWGHGITTTEVTQFLVQPFIPPDAAFPANWLQDLFGNGYEIMATNYLSVPSFDINTLIGQDLTLNVRVYNNDTDELLVPWIAADQLNYSVPQNLGGISLRLNFWLNSNANGITNAYEDLIVPVTNFFAPPAFPSGWIPAFMFQKQLSASEAFQFNAFDPSTVTGTGNLVLRVRFMNGQTQLTPWEFVEESNYTPAVELVNETLTIEFALTDGEATANGSFLLTVQP